MSRQQHGSTLRTALLKAEAEAKQRRAELGITLKDDVPGIRILFESQPGVPLKLSSLEDARQGIAVENVTHVMTTDAEPRRIERALVFVPEGKVKHFLSRFASYAKETPKKKGERRNESMIDPIAALRLATLRALWTDAEALYPQGDDRIWWEVWLRRHDELELSRLSELAEQQGLVVGERRLQFDDRIVVLVSGTPSQIAVSVDVLNDIAELRLAKETASFFEKMPPDEQTEWADDLLNRTEMPPNEAPAVCVLDTGVNRGHPLLKDALDASDCHAVDPSWGVSDNGAFAGHGTEMAGLALYGDLTSVLTSQEAVRLGHRLESVKVLPPRGNNIPELYGAVTAEATARVEIQQPRRARCFAMAITASDERDRGQPTSWSAAVDALAVGRSFDQTTRGLNYLNNRAPSPRLFVLSAGNVSPDLFQLGYLERCDLKTAEDPAQAWNALTVGAFTDKAFIQDPTFSSWNPVAKPGNLSPWSTTSVPFEDIWPVKPDVVFEGGNIAVDSQQNIEHACADLCLLSTNHKYSKGSLFVSTWGTSAATAQAARVAAIIKSEYPSLWPETVRALMVHSAEWTPVMQSALDSAPGKRARGKILRRYGYGVPRLSRALWSASDALTLIAQSSIHPFSDGKMGEMHVFELPWPREVLQDLGDAQARLRVTLSYFIEPNPGRRGWKNRYRYQSHGLRFDVMRPTENVDAFRKRMNKLALEEEDEKPSSGGSSLNWYLGEHARNHGSIHSDVLRDISAADLAECGVIGVYPVSGWWKDQKKRDRSARGTRYALVVSIETPRVDTDIWTPVAQQIGIPITIGT